MNDLSNASAIYDCPVDMEESIYIPPDPVAEPWLAAQYLMDNSHGFLTKFVSKEEYEEHGNSICDQRFKDYAPKERYEHSENTEWFDDDCQYLNGELIF